jgi:glycosyltransferase involved in cell wall biosynthesis
LSQNYNNLEYIIIDGSSKDGTLSIIDRYRDKISNVVVGPDEGPGHALNKALNYATGEVIGFLNADDYFTHSNVISIISKKFISREIDGVFGDMEYVNSSDKITRVWKSVDYYPNAFLKGWSLPFPTFYIKKECYKKYGGIDTSYKICDDFELTFRMIHLNKIKVARINKKLVSFHNSGRSSQLHSRIQGLKEILRVFKKNNIKVNLILFLFNRYVGKVKSFKIWP